MTGMDRSLGVGPVARRGRRTCGRFVVLAGAAGLSLLPMLAGCTREGDARPAAHADARPVTRTAAPSPTRAPFPPRTDAARAARDTLVAHDTLRVCADPNNLPFSNKQDAGFENRIATLIANELHATVTYTWWAQRRGFIRNTLNAHQCDLLTGIPNGDDMVLTTAPYYRSTYVFVTRRDRGLHIRSLDDPRLHRLRIGMHLIGDDGNALPPGVSLAKRGIIRNVRGYSIYGDYSKPNPPAALIDAVARGDIDVAIAWGPLAGYVAQRESVPLEITPVTPANDGPAAHFVFAIAMGVRHGDTAFKAQLERVLQDKRAEIHQILTAYGVPLVDEEGRVVLRAASRAPCAAKTAEAACE